MLVLEITTAVVVSCGGLKSLPVHRFSVVNFTFSGPLGQDSRVQHLFDSRVSLNPGLGGVRDVASASIPHEQTQQNRACCFQALDAVFSDYLLLPDITTLLSSTPPLSYSTSLDPILHLPPLSHSPGWNRMRR